MKETCYDIDAGPLSSEVITRLYHAKSRRYICFNKKGKIRTVVSGLITESISDLDLRYF